MFHLDFYVTFFLFVPQKRNVFVMFLTYFCHGCKKSACWFSGINKNIKSIQMSYFLWLSIGLGWYINVIDYTDPNLQKKKKCTKKTNMATVSRDQNEPKRCHCQSSKVWEYLKQRHVTNMALCQLCNVEMVYRIVVQLLKMEVSQTTLPRQ